MKLVIEMRFSTWGPAELTQAATAHQRLRVYHEDLDDHPHTLLEVVSFAVH